MGKLIYGSVIKSIDAGGMARVHEPKLPNDGQLPRKPQTKHSYLFHAQRFDNRLVGILQINVERVQHALDWNKQSSMEILRSRGREDTS